MTSEILRRDYMNSQMLVILITLVTLILFVHGRLRYDFVSLLCLLTLVLTGLVAPEDAFVGFGHPAVVTVAAVLIISNALIKTGAIDRLVTLVDIGPDNLQFKIFSLMLLTATLSAFMNNVGALALIMPICLSIANDKDIPASQLLMPVAFASLLGGMTTSIGTPPNLIVSTYRVQAGGEAYSFFAFLPTGLALTMAGILFTVILGWKFIPVRISRSLKDRFNLEDYLFELIVTDECDPEGIKLIDFAKTYGVHINVVAIIREDYRVVSPKADQEIFPGDILIVKSVSKKVNQLIQKSCLKLKGADTEKLISHKNLRSDDVALVEVVLRDDSPLIGRTTVETRLRTRYNANLIAVSSKGVTSIDRLKDLVFRNGDILLLQVPKVSLEDVYSKMRCLPLAEREVSLSVIDSNLDQIITISIFLLSIILTSLELLPVQISFLLASVLLIIFRVISPREFYDSIEWPTIIMIGSLFALGQALESSGGSDSIAGLITKLSLYFSPQIILAIMMSITIILTNLINNNAATILMAPIGISVANNLGLAYDPFLMAICIGACISFMTPIAHQSNTLIMGPGGFKFTDYWQLGLPLSILSVLVGVPVILLVWPL